MKSWINNHEIRDIFHYVSFLIHDGLIPIYLISSILQFFYFKKKIHEWNGYFLTKYMTFPLFISGLLLSIYSKYPYLFIIYGLSFLLFSQQTIYSIKKIYHVKIYHKILFIAWIYVFYKLYPYNDKKIQFVNVTFPIPLLHLYNNKNLSHPIIAQQYLYLSWLGTFFSLTQHMHTSYFYMKIIIQQIPLFCYLYNLFHTS